MSAPRITTSEFSAGQADLLQSAAVFETDTGLMKVADGDGNQYPINGVVAHQYSFTETDGVDSTYTATCVVPAGYTVQEILFQNNVLWNAATSASLVIGDGADANGYYEATNVKTTPALANACYTLEIAAGAYRGGRYYASAGLITAVIQTDDSGSHHAGRSIMTIIMIPPAAEVTAAVKAAV